MVPLYIRIKGRSKNTYIGGGFWGNDCWDETKIVSFQSNLIPSFQLKSHVVWDAVAWITVLISTTDPPRCSEVVIRTPTAPHWRWLRRAVKTLYPLHSSVCRLLVSGRQHGIGDRKGGSCSFVSRRHINVSLPFLKQQTRLRSRCRAQHYKALRESPATRRFPAGCGLVIDSTPSQFLI